MDPTSAISCKLESKLDYITKRMDQIAAVALKKTALKLLRQNHKPILISSKYLFKLNDLKNRENPKMKFHQIPVI